MLPPEDQLANEWYQEHLIETGEIIYAEACSFCGRTYVPQDLTGQFCSDKCRVAHIRRSSGVFRDITPSVREYTDPDKTLPFSERYGYSEPAAETTVYQDAPAAVRDAVDMLSKRAGLSRNDLRTVICEVLLRRPNRNNWSEYPNIDQEIKDLIADCPWHKVYDIAEGVYALIALRWDVADATEFSNRLSQVFRENGIGWEMRDGLIVVRDDVLMPIYSEAINVLEETDRTFAANELKEAIRDISRRPDPDISGAIQHAIAGLEAVARDVTGNPTPTLGALVQRLPIPDDLKEAVRKLWRYSSENARHGREGNDPDLMDAKLVVTVACAVSTFLVERHNASQQ